MGMVIPSEIGHVMHAQSLRSYIGEVCSKIVIIDPKEIWFEDTLQGAVIIGLPRTPSKHGFFFAIALLAQTKKSPSVTEAFLSLISVQSCLAFIASDWFIDKAQKHINEKKSELIKSFSKVNDEV
jgi:hypothetical protein